MLDLVRIRCFILPLSLVIALPVLLTPAAVLPWLLGRTGNRSETRITLEIDLLASLASLESLLTSSQNGSIDDEEFRLASETTQPRPLRRGINVGENETSFAPAFIHRDIGAGSANYSLLLRPVSRIVRAPQNEAGLKGSGDDSQGGIRPQTGRSGEARASDPRNYRRRH